MVHCVRCPLSATLWRSALFCGLCLQCLCLECPSRRPCPSAPPSRRNLGHVMQWQAAADHVRSSLAVIESLPGVSHTCNVSCDGASHSMGTPEHVPQQAYLHNVLHLFYKNQRQAQTSASRHNNHACTPDQRRRWQGGARLYNIRASSPEMRTRLPFNTHSVTPLNPPAAPGLCGHPKTLPALPPLRLAPTGVTPAPACRPGATRPRRCRCRCWPRRSSPSTR
jgi:hypothetical protein